MRAETELKNIRAINDFFEGYGTDTAKEFSESILNLVIMVAEKQDLSQAGKEDLTTKLKDLNRLVLQLGKIEKVPVVLSGVFQEN